ncbi:MAG: DUF2490 domain-containing protein [Chitinophagaceae bacterium]
MNKQIIVCLIAILIAKTTLSQTKQTTSLQQTWLGYYNQTRFSDKWGIWADLHLRTKDNYFSNLSATILRAGLTYYVSDAVKLTAGYGYISHYPSDNHKGFAQPEHRPWQQIQVHTKYAKTRTMQILRLEERYRRKTLNDSTLADSYSFNWRLRYNFLFQVPLSKRGPEPKTLSFIANNEVMIAFGKQVVNNYFDQNRFFLGFAYHTNKTDNVQFGFTNVFQQLPAGNQYRSINGGRVYYFHNVDLRKKK